MKDRNRCALCLAQTELCKSHYLPKSLFRVVTQSAEPHDKAPTVYDANTGKVFCTNSQPTMSLLCSECEQRFSKHGENEVVKNCYRSSSKYKLLDRINQRESDGFSGNRKSYFGKGFNNNLNANAYYYFALSMLWRGSVGNWPPPYSEFKGKLGQKYTQLIADYLQYPLVAIPDVYVNVYVDTDSPSQTWLTPVSAEKINREGLRAHFHSFVIPGAQFVVLVGGEARKILNGHYDTSQVTFYEWSFTESELYQRAASEIQRAK